MRLLIKQRVFSWSDTYDVYDEEGNVRSVSYTHLTLPTICSV